MKLTVIWKPGNPMKSEVYLDGKLLNGCKYVDVEMTLHRAEGCVLKGEIEGEFVFKDGVVRRML